MQTINATLQTTNAIATLQTTNALATTMSVNNKSQLLAQSVDSIALLANSHAQLSQMRRDQIRPILKQEYSNICFVEVKPDVMALW